MEAPLRNDDVHDPSNEAMNERGATHRLYLNRLDVPAVMAILSMVCFGPFPVTILYRLF